MTQELWKFIIPSPHLPISLFPPSTENETAWGRGGSSLAPSRFNHSDATEFGITVDKNRKNPVYSNFVLIPAVAPLSRSSSAMLKT